MFKKYSQTSIYIVLIIILLVLVNIISYFLFFKLDLTEDNKYSLSDETIVLIDTLQDEIFIDVLLEGEFVAGFKKLQTSTQELLNEYKRHSDHIKFRFRNPYAGTKEEIKAFHESLRQMGILPTQLIEKSMQGSSDKQAFPVAIIYNGEKREKVNLLENQIPGMSDPQIVVNNSISLLEYKFSSAIKRLMQKDRPIIAFTTGKGELNAFETSNLEYDLRKNYDIGRIHLDSVVFIDDKIDMLLIARPRAPYSDRDKFKLDQYVMNGGKIIWMIDKLNVCLDSLRGKPAYVPYDYPLNLDDLLFKYGVRVKPNMCLDVQCTKIPLNIGVVGSTPQLELFDWFYHVKVTPNSKHIISKGVGEVEMKFPSTIDTIKTKLRLQKTPLLVSSKNTKLQFIPARISFEIAKNKSGIKKYNKGKQNLGILLEGKFESLFKNRITEQFRAGLDELGITFKENSSFNSMLIIADGDFILNEYNLKDRATLPLGFNKYEGKLYNNKDFILNSIEYMIGGGNLINARSKKVKLRLIDLVKASNNRFVYQLINVILPIILVLIFGIIFNVVRKRRFAK